MKARLCKRIGVYCVLLIIIFMSGCGNNRPVRTYSPEIDQIILDEAALYFDGTKTVAEVVAVIVDRLRTYVLENM